MKTIWKLILVCAGGFVAGSPGLASGAESAAPVQQTVSDNYRIGPGDMLHISVWQHPDLSGPVPVRPDGKISAPLVEDLVAVGKSSSQLAREVEAILAEYLKSPKVSVIVTGAVSTFSQVRAVGQVKQSVALPYREGLRVLDLLQASGGLTDFAAPNRAYISREANGKEEKLPVRLGDLVNKGDRKQDRELQPGDVLFVPQSRL